MSKIDDVIEQIGAYFHHDAGENYIRLMDTPRVWGLGFGREIMPRAQARQLEFQHAIEEIIHKAKYRVDIVSLNPPDVDWLRVILGAMDTCLSTVMDRRASVQFRFLFGETPTKVDLSQNDFYGEIKAALVRLVRGRSDAWEQQPEIWIGKFCRISDGAISRMMGGDTRMTWNHTKAVAADGCEALVGGHNLNMDLFRSYPPVHDVSVVVHGSAAYGVQMFMNGMWTCDTTLLSKEVLELPANEWKAKNGARSSIVDPFADRGVMAAVEEAQGRLVDMHRARAQGGAPPPAETLPAAEAAMKANDHQTVEEVYEDFPVRVFREHYTGFDEYKRATRVLSVGKYWNGPGLDNYQKASEIMKETLIKGARRTIKMSQMDLVSTWKESWKDHVVCQWIIEALLANEALNVYVVVSPLDAGAGAGGDPYSFGSGAVRTYGLMEYYLTHEVDTDEKIADAEELRKRKHALGRLHIAPLYYTDQVPDEKTTEGDTYFWPDLDRAGYTATVKEQSLAENPPKKGIIGSAANSVLKGSGMVYEKVPSAPGNHAKIMIIDDEAYVVGSDNLYPGFLSEFNYLIEGDAVRCMLDEYWEQLWGYSQPHCCVPKDD
ncbi:hypothetical protein ENSA5_37070 [Enhygromyxa salina]|uniref:PLD phosphodiesterase domain-containing protein n=1 Tax=Enhygromyxa salina TaxID=215803 RepID=A0A2S9XSK5_9BACT|nr:phospholipase [Enhygromyxa salina]PRP95838.1 hypothetical protein ENSA5_37070 [Enhygromyxa salina]